MNKKIFTLLAASLMLFTAFAASAQTGVPRFRDSLQYLPLGIGKGAYHLHLTHLGKKVVSDKGKVLALSENGYLELIDSAVYKGTKYQDLRRSLWCIKVSQENLGRVPAYTFINKEFGMDLSVRNEFFKGKRYGSNPEIYMADTVFGSPVLPESKRKYIQSQVVGKNEDVLIGGEYNMWRFSRTYNTVPLERNQPLKIEIDGEPDYFLTFAVRDTNGVDSLRLVKVHARDFDSTARMYPYIARFTLMEAGPRVLSAEDFNTRMGEQTISQTHSEGGVQLFFDPEVKGTGIKNVFSSSKLWAIDASTTEYMTLQHYGSKEFITVLDGNVEDNYYNGFGYKYPKIDTRPAADDNGRSDFRLVYYPSEDSVIINVRRIDHIEAPIGVRVDDGVTRTLGENLYNWEIWNHLIVRFQDLGSANVITVRNKPANVRAHFGLHECSVMNDARATVEPDLYTVKDQDGRYLVMTLENGDYTPAWKKLEDGSAASKGNLEDPLKTPAYQWLVTKANPTSSISRIHLTNREFDNVRIEFVQVYKGWRLFTGRVNELEDLNPDANYGPVFDKKFVKFDESFTRVEDDKEAAEMKAKVGFDKMPEALQQKLYRTNPFLGYRYLGPDTLNYAGYSLKYNTYLSDSVYLGLKDNVNETDSLVYVYDEPTYFEFKLPDTLRSLISKGAPVEKYGIGHKDNLLNLPTTKDIAKLQRSYYELMVSDYWRIRRNDQYVVLDDNGRYAFTTEENARRRSIGESKFYLRYTYDKENSEYYTLLDRVDKSDFDYMTDVFNLSLSDTLKAYDDSHGSIRTKAFGVIVGSVDEYNAFLKARPKTLASNVVSTFALRQINEPLYRRFNDTKTDGGLNDDDTPRLLKFHSHKNPNFFLLESANSINDRTYDEKKINYLGYEHELDKDPKKGQWFNTHNYIIYVDTAYVNRGTGHIKPQYLLVVDPKVKAAESVETELCGTINVDAYVAGRYLVNATDSAREKSFITAAHPKVRDKNYIWQEKWERLAFVDAIHMGDSLYILKGHKPEAFYGKCIRADKSEYSYLNKNKLKAAAAAGKIDIKPLDNNLHKDYVFSMRFVERQVNKKGQPTNAGKHFYIESETTNRSATMGRMIAPNYGGWIKIHNFVPVISRGAYGDARTEAMVFDVQDAKTTTPEDATANETVVDGVKVVGGEGQVSVLNAAGKQVVVSNILGQIVAKQTLTSDNVSINAPKGVVVVTVDGKDAVKAVVR